MLPAFAKANGLSFSNREGWLSGIFDRITSQYRKGAPGYSTSDATVYDTGDIRIDVTADLSSVLPDIDAKINRDALGEEARYIELGVCCPVPESLGNCRQEIRGVVFYGFQEDLTHPEIYNSGLETRFSEILDDFRPDIVHIFGTEFPHTLSMTRAFGSPEHTLIGIQGLCRTIADTYMADLPYRVRRRKTFRDRVRRDSIEAQQHKYEMRARNERLAILGTGHVTGRTVLDRRETNAINPDALYHPMNETMRSCFYSGRWNPENCEAHSIFLSQGDYPLKGFHYLLLAMPRVLEQYPDAKIYCAGNSIIGNYGGLYPETHKVPLALRISSYGKYLLHLIHELHLEGHVFMTGSLSAGEMKDRFLSSNVFVCPSIMENSPNSLCEAMLLGMPVVAARVGGVPDLINDGEEGLLFTGGSDRELADCIIRVLDDSDFSYKLGAQARRTAKVRHNPDTNFRRLVEIYRSML